MDPDFVTSCFVFFWFAPLFSFLTRWIILSFAEKFDCNTIFRKAKVRASTKKTKANQIFQQPQHNPTPQKAKKQSGPKKKKQKLTKSDSTNLCAGSWERIQTNFEENESLVAHHQHIIYSSATLPWESGRRSRDKTLEPHEVSRTPLLRRSTRLKNSWKTVLFEIKLFIPSIVKDTCLQYAM